MIAAHYADELRWLREGGKAFASAHPQAARWLGEAGADPDVERLLEGVAFLCARIRGRLDEGRPELTHALLAAFLPHLVRPWPAMALVQLTAPRTARGPIAVPAGAVIESTPVEGRPCRFRTAWSCVVPAWSVASIGFHEGRLVVELVLREGADATQPPGRLRFHCHGEAALARALRQALLSGRATVDGRELVCRGAGLDASETLLPEPVGSPAPWRLLAEYRAFPEKFLAVDVEGCPAGRRLSLVWELPRVARELAGVSTANLLLGVVPAVNAWPVDGEPVLVDAARREFRVRGSGCDPQRTRIIAIESVSGMARGGQRRRWHPVLDAAGCPGPCWQELRQPAASGGGDELLLALSPLDPQAEGEVLSLELLGSDGPAAGMVPVGELRVPGPGMPPGVTVRNLAVPARPVYPVLLPDLHRRLLDHLALGGRPLADISILRRLVSLHDLRAVIDDAARQAQDRLQASILALRSRAGTRLVDGTPVRALETELDLDEERLGGSGEVHLLGSILDRCLAGLASLNTASVLSIRCQQSGEILRWPARLGSRSLR